MSGTVSKLRRSPLDRIESQGDIADRFVEEHGDGVRYVGRVGWYVWTGTHWRIEYPDDPVTVRQLAQDTLQDLKREGVDIGNDDLIETAIRLRTNGQINGIISIAKDDERIRAKASDFDSKPHLLSVENGTVDLRSGDIRPHDSADMITAYVPTPYDADATSEHFDDLLERLVPDEGARAYLQRAVGYSLFADPVEDVFFLLVGETRSGKSTLRDAIFHALGDGLVARIRMETLTTGRGSDASTARSDLDRLRGKRFAMASEAEPGQRFASGQLKGLTGGEPLVTRTMYAKESESPVTFCIWIVANPEDLPHLRAEDEAIWERARMIPVGAKIPKAERDPRFGEKLQSETGRRAVLAWAIQGGIEYHEHGLGTPPSVVKAGESLRVDMDGMGDFVQTRLIFDVDAEVASEDIREALREYLGEGRRMPSDKAISNRIRAKAKKRGVSVVADRVRKETVDDVTGKAVTKQVRGWKGVGLV